MKNSLRLLMTSVALVIFLYSGAALAQDQYPPAAADSELQGWADSELDDLVSRIALYSDPLIAQILQASAYPLEVVQATRWLDDNQALKGSSSGEFERELEQQPWDPSVKALVNFPTVLYMLNDDLDWTTDLGDAFVNQQEDVMRAIQRMRMKANTAGHLVTTSQQNVIVQDQIIRIVPADPQVIYVPTYNPQVVYLADPPAEYTTGEMVATGLISFGLGVAVGSWWNDDDYYEPDWHHGYLSRGDVYINNTNINNTNINNFNGNNYNHGGGGDRGDDRWRPDSRRRTDGRGYGGHKGKRTHPDGRRDMMKGSQQHGAQGHGKKQGGGAGHKQGGQVTAGKQAGGNKRQAGHSATKKHPGAGRGQQGGQIAAGKRTGAGQTHAGTVKKRTGGAQTHAGTVKKRTGAGQTHAGTVKKRTGAGQPHAGTVTKRTGGQQRGATIRKQTHSAGTVKKRSGGAQPHAGTVTKRTGGQQRGATIRKQTHSAGTVKKRSGGAQPRGGAVTKRTGGQQRGATVKKQTRSGGNVNKRTGGGQKQNVSSSNKKNKKDNDDEKDKKGRKKNGKK